MLKFSFVIGRYGLNILGGAEKHARDVAERLAARGHHVRVHTTCATSYATWLNDQPAGMSELSGVEVVRHPTRMQRLRPWDEVLKAMSSAATGIRSLAHAWAFAQGPVSPALLEAVGREGAERHLTVFFSLLSRLTFAGIPPVQRRSALVPLVHEEPPIYTAVARDALQMARVLLVNTEEEAQRIHRVTGGGLPPVGIVAVGREQAPVRRQSFTRPTSAPYLVILGRLGKTKPMLPVWRSLMEQRDLPPLEIGGKRIPWSEVRLVTVGQLSPIYKDIPNVIALDFVNDEERWQILRHAIALINPSIYESLSLVLLEAWACGLPVVVNTACDVTVGQCARSGGGVAVEFRDPRRAAREIAAGLASEANRRAMGDGGDRYARTRYDWDRVLDVYERVASAVGEGGSVKDALGDTRWEPVASSSRR